MRGARTVELSLTLNAQMTYFCPTTVLWGVRTTGDVMFEKNTPKTPLKGVNRQFQTKIYTSQYLRN